MEQFIKIGDYDVSAIQKELLARPELWDIHKERRTSPRSPHREMKDIWLRYRKYEELTSSHAYMEPHFAEFYPAWWKLPALHAVVYDIMAKSKATYLGGILITKIPPGCQIYPHADGGWHATTMNHKVYLPLFSNDNCVNICLDEQVVMREGELWTFNNTVTHSVENRGTSDRATLIVSMRTEHELS